MAAIKTPIREQFQAELLDVQKPPQIGAEELTEALRRHFAGIDGLALDSDLAIARELVRRARWLEQLERTKGDPQGPPCAA